MTSQSLIIALIILISLITSFQENALALNFDFVDENNKLTYNKQKKFSIKTENIEINSIYGSNSHEYILVNKSTGKILSFEKKNKELIPIFNTKHRIRYYFINSKEVFVIDEVESTSLNLWKISLNGKEKKRITFKNESNQIEQLRELKDFLVIDNMLILLTDTAIFSLKVNYSSHPSSTYDTESFERLINLSEEPLNFFYLENPKTLIITSKKTRRIYSYTLGEKTISLLNPYDKEAKDIFNETKASLLNHNNNKLLNIFNGKNQSISLFSYDRYFKTLDLEKNIKLKASNRKRYEARDFDFIQSKENLIAQKGNLAFMAIFSSGTWIVKFGKSFDYNIDSISFGERLNSYLVAYNDSINYYSRTPDSELSLPKSQAAKEIQEFYDDFAAKNYQNFHPGELFTIKGVKLSGDLKNDKKALNSCEFEFLPKRYWCNSFSNIEDLDNIRKHLAKRLEIKSTYELCKNDDNTIKSKFRSIEFSSKANIQKKWNAHRSNYLNQKYGFRLSFLSENSASIDTHSGRLWVYIGEQDKGENNFSSNYFDINSPKEIYIKPHSPKTNMNLRKSPVKSQSDWLLGEHISFLNKKQKIHVDRNSVMSIIDNDNEKIRYWAGGSIESPDIELNDEWIVVIGSFSKKNNAKNELDKLKSIFKSFTFEILYSESQNKYVISIGKSLNQREAIQILSEAKCVGMSKDAYIILPIDKEWQEL